jgi:PST family polysaccharide transporter
MADDVNGIGVDSPSGSPNKDVGAVQEPGLHKEVFARTSSDQLKRKSVQGGVITVGAQGFSFVAQTGSTMILARLLSPADFGVTGMVAAITGFLAMFGDVGLGAATVQRKEVTHDELSTLFWINAGAGAALMLVASAMAPALVAFYHEPRLFWVTIISSFSFLLGGLGAQHGALLQRGMRYATMAKVGVISLGLSSALGIVMAALGCRYWSLVAMGVSSSLFRAAGWWLVVPWRPGRPVAGRAIRSMVHFGGTVTLNNLVVYVSYNIEKVLLGRSFGADQLGIYGRAYQLLNLPLQQLHAAIYTVAFPALSAIQDNAERLYRSFLRGYSILLALTLPITMASSLYSEELIRILLGPKWMAAAPILRLLTPTILAFALINPFGWFLVATGRQVRSLLIALVIAPVVVVGIVIGMRHGPQGVATGYSAAMTLLLAPVILWSIQGTGLSAREYWRTARMPLIAGLAASACGLGLKLALAGKLPPIAMFIVGMCVCGGVYSWILLIPMRQKEVYADLLHHLLERFRSKTAKSKSS